MNENRGKGFDRDREIKANGRRNIKNSRRKPKMFTSTTYFIITVLIIL